MWIGETVYFLSDRDGEFNLYSYDRHVEEGRALHPSRGLPGRQRLGRRGQGHLRAGRLDSPLRPGARQVAPAQDRRGRRPGRDPAPVCRAARSTSATCGSRPPASGPCSSIAARSSPSRPRRATRTTSPRPRACTNARRPGRPTASRSPISPTPPGEYALVVRPQDGKGEGRVLPAQGVRLLRRACAGRPTARRSPSSTTRAPLSWIDLATGERQAGRGRADLRAGPGLADEIRLVARLEVAGLLAHQPHRLPGDLALFDSRRTSPTP